MINNDDIVINTDLTTIVAGLYGEQYTGGKIRADRDYTEEFLSILTSLLDRVFPGYGFDREQVLTRLRKKLRGQSMTVHNYDSVRLQFSYLGENRPPLILSVGRVHEGGRLGIYTEDEAINRQIRDLFLERNMEDTVS